MSRNSAPFRARFSLTFAVYGFVVAAIFLATAGAAAVVLTRSEGIVDDTLDDIVRLRTVASGQFFTRRLHEDWIDLQHLTEIAGEQDFARLSAMMAGIQGNGERISWIGFADTDGRVLEATGDLLVGGDVSSRPWFTNGLRGDFAGDVHDAVLLANLLRPDSEQPLRFIDLAQPVRNAEGDVLGVLGMHINAAWVLENLREAGVLLELDLFLMNAGGEVVVGPGEDRPNLAGLELMGAARTGTVSAAREVWPDGHEYFTALVPSLNYRSLPSFGWRLAGRIDPQSFRPGYAAFQSMALSSGIVALLILAAITVLFVRIFVYPIVILGKQASRIARGDDVFPKETTSTLEAERISHALATLQGRAFTPAPTLGQRSGASDPE